MLPRFVAAYANDGGSDLARLADSQSEQALPQCVQLDGLGVVVVYQSSGGSGGPCWVDRSAVLLRNGADIPAIPPGVDIAYSEFVGEVVDALNAAAHAYSIRHPERAVLDALQRRLDACRAYDSTEHILMVAYAPFVDHPQCTRCGARLNLPLSALSSSSAVSVLSDDGASATDLPCFLDLSTTDDKAVRTVFCKQCLRERRFILSP